MSSLILPKTCSDSLLKNPKALSCQSRKLTLAREFLAIDVSRDTEERLAVPCGLGDVVLQAWLHLVQHHHWVHGGRTFWDLLGRIGNFHWFSRLEWKFWFCFQWLGWLKKKCKRNLIWQSVEKFMQTISQTMIHTHIPHRFILCSFHLMLILCFHYPCNYIVF